MKKIVFMGSLSLAVVGGVMLVGCSTSTGPAKISVTKRPAKEIRIADAWKQQESPPNPDALATSWNVMDGVPLEQGKERTDRETVEKVLGTKIKLPKHQAALAAGEPAFLVEEGFNEFAGEGRVAARPQSNESGSSMIIKYPNGLIIRLKVRHPEDPTKNYKGHVKSSNKETRVAIDNNWPGDNSLREMTTVNGFEGYQLEQGYNGGYNDFPKVPRGAVVVWYEPDSWIEYSIAGPINVPLKDLREVVDSMYAEDGNSSQNSTGAPNK